MSGDGSVLVVNAGSHSLKLAILDPGLTVLDSAAVDAAPDSEAAARGLAEFLARAGAVSAVGHRIVHGGPDLTEATLIDDDVREQLQRLTALAPQHLPPALAALDQCRSRLPDVAHVACFDTAFHTRLPDTARTYPVPQQWREEFGVRRYGFHGLSYAWALRRASELLGRPASHLQLLLAHVGGGASVCAVHHGVSVSTSMGFTPLEGLMMSTRSGTVDPGMILWLQTHHGLSAAEVSDGLEHHSGLLGLSNGRSGDTRELVAAAADSNLDAALALGVFCLRIRQELAAAAASLDRIDALVFTGEIGADQPEIREAVCARLSVLGFAGDLDRSQDRDGILSTAGIPVLLVHPREDAQITLETRRTLRRPTGAQS